MSDMSAEYEGPRGATPREFGELLDFVNYVFRADQGRRPSMGGDYPHLYHESNAELFRHIRHGGRIVSCVNIYRAETRWDDATLLVGAIGGVATDPEHRRGGLAGRNLEDALDYMAGAGYDASILWTGITDYYRRWGWENVGEMWRFNMDRTTINYLPIAPSGEVLTGFDDDRVIDGVKMLHDRERRGVERDRDLTAIMLSTRTRHRVALLVVDDEPVAYIVYKFGDRFFVEDCGGDPDAILGLVRIAYGELGVRGAEVTLRAEKVGVAEKLMEVGFRPNAGYQGMIAVIDPASIVRKYGIDGVSFERAPREDKQSDDWLVTHDGNEQQYSANDLAKLLFGPERPGGLVHPKLPLPFHYGALDHM